MSARVGRLRQLLGTLGADAFLVASAHNLRYLTGFSGSNGLALIDESRIVLVTDARYRIQAGLETEAAGSRVELHITNDPGAVLSTAGRGLARIAFEAEHVTVARREVFAEGIAGELVPTVDVVERLRQDKDPHEIELLSTAAGIADDAFTAIWDLLGEKLPNGLTERRVAAELDHMMRLGGADAPSFDTIVASGPNGAKPHARPGDRVIQKGDLVVLDFGARVDGYGSDMTRTVSAGACPSDRQLELYDAVLTAQRAGVATVADGVPELAVDRACRNLLTDRGLGEAFSHGTGHGIGLQIHESPILSTRSVGILRSGLVITVEPGIYLPDIGGIRVEDSVVVSSSGCTPITHSPKGLVPAFS
ncbi:MAG: Xaa-Pro peptidase family protein [Actinomycetota bacterium]|nr:Xaa-Pro peptidase family protein [Actinomycetota bacterium]